MCVCVCVKEREKDVCVRVGWIIGSVTRHAQYLGGIHLDSITCEIPTRNVRI